MLKIAIVGCGKIADSHASQIRQLQGCEIVAVCEQEELMARQLCERFAVRRHYDDTTKLLREARPDVVHITTPPQSHFEIARQCLEAGCHVYVEKPITLYTAELEELIALSKQRGLKLTVGHDEQFSHSARHMRELIRSGYLGGTPIHMESTWCYDLGDPTYAKALLADTAHWVRRLPGKLLHNVISHGIAKISEFLITPTPTVIAHGYVGPLLSSLGAREIVDELRVIISDEHRTTAYFTFSSQMRPSLDQFLIYGPQNGLFLDEKRQTLIKLRGSRYKSYLEQFVPPLALARQYLDSSYRNLRLFLRREFHQDAGKKCLIESLYRSIIDGTPVPIPYDQILRTSRIMDAIFEQISSRGTARQRAGVVHDLRSPESMELP